jgi:hypothetical protein
LADAVGEAEMGDWIFVAVLGAAAVHIFEEYVYPGGFPDGLKNLLPRVTHLFTLKFHIVVNVVFFLLCLISAFIGKANLVMSLSIFGLIFTNAVLHIRGAIIKKGYYPGVISGVFIYIPLTVYAYTLFITSQQLTLVQAGLSFLLGVLYMGILMVYVLVQQRGDTKNIELRKQ